jgi:hypothetical protein
VECERIRKPAEYSLHVQIEQASGAIKKGIVAIEKDIG